MDFKVRRQIKERRQVLCKAFGPHNYRITKHYAIDVYGQMPNSNKTGWYLWGGLFDWETEERIRSLSASITTED